LLFATREPVPDYTSDATPQYPRDFFFVHLDGRFADEQLFMHQFGKSLTLEWFHDDIVLPKDSRSLLWQQ
jgi:hypothetical protein